MLIAGGDWGAYYVILAGCFLTLFNPRGLYQEYFRLKGSELSGFQTPKMFQEISSPFTYANVPHIALHEDSSIPLYIDFSVQQLQVSCLLRS